MIRRLGLLIAAMVLAGACSSDPQPPQNAVPAPVPAEAHTSDPQPDIVASSTGVELVRCDPDAQHPSANAEWYRETPRYVGNEQPTSEVRAWAFNLPGFQELWIDRDNNGWISVAFDRDVELRQREILEQFPNDGVVAVLVDWNLADLRQLQQEVTDHLLDEGLSSFGVGVSTQEGLVQVSVGVLTDERLEALAPFIHEPVCVEGLDPEGATLDGPQLETGPGWRLLALQGSGASRGNNEALFDGFESSWRPRVELATNEMQLATLWRVGLGATETDDLPEVDSEREIVVLVSDIESGSCPIRFDGLRIDNDATRLELVQVVADEFVMCTSDANPVAYVIAIARDAIPQGSFIIAASAELWVDADLSATGAVVADAATLAEPRTGATPVPVPPGTEPDARPTAPPAPGSVTSDPPRSIFPLVLEPGFPSTYKVPAECFSLLGMVNGFVWQARPEDGGGLPDDWLASADAAGRLLAELLLLTNDTGNPQLEVTVAGITRTYNIVDDLAASC